jgi:hypothetical protein
MHYFWLLTLSSTLFSNFYMLSELHSLNLKLCSKQYNKKFVLHLIVAPHISSGWQHNYSTKTRQLGRANEQAMYSLISMHLIAMLPPHFSTVVNYECKMSMTKHSIVVIDMASPISSN